jgi:hypothetical protein
MRHTRRSNTEVTAHDVLVVRRTPRALCVHDADCQDAWLPLSQIKLSDDDAQRGDVISIRGPLWLMVRVID